MSVSEMWEMGRGGSLGLRLGKSLAYVSVFPFRSEVFQGQRLVLLMSRF